MGTTIELHKDEYVPCNRYQIPTTLDSYIKSWDQEVDYEDVNRC